MNANVFKKAFADLKKQPPLKRREENIAENNRSVEKKVKENESENEEEVRIHKPLNKRISKPTKDDKQ